jgi:hypothetical protein
MLRIILKFLKIHKDSLVSFTQKNYIQNFDISEKNIINVKAAKVIIYGSELSLSLSLSLSLQQEGGGSWTMLYAHQVQICSFSTKDMFFTSDRNTILSLYSQCHDCQLVGG